MGPWGLVRLPRRDGLILVYFADVTAAEGNKRRAYWHDPLLGDRISSKYECVGSYTANNIL